MYCWKSEHPRSLCGVWEMDLSQQQGKLLGSQLYFAAEIPELLMNRVLNYHDL